MKNLQEATERICELKGGLIALHALLPGLLEALPHESQEALARTFEAHAEAARTALLHADISDHVLAAFERDTGRTRQVLAGIAAGRSAAGARPAVEPVLLTSTRLGTFNGTQALSGATGFFFRREARLFLVTNRHVLSDEPSAHFPDRIEIALHTDAQDLTRIATFSIPLYRNGRSLWRQATDSGGAVDVAVIELERDKLPEGTVLHAFEPEHLTAAGEDVGVGDAVTVIGFPLGFHDTVHHLAVARSATIASAFGVRFQQLGYFLTDARTHRGSSGSPVMRRRTGAAHRGAALPWQLLGVHSSRMDMQGRDLAADESLGLNCAWYADVLLALTEARP